MGEIKPLVKNEVSLEEAVSQPILRKKKWEKIELVGLALIIASLSVMMISPGTLAGLFTAMVDKVFPVVVEVFLTGTVGVTIIVSVVIGRTLERLGFTDALIRVFLPVTKLLKINSAVLIPSIYNILGDINAAGKISGPILVRSGATKAEQKMAVATMVQSQQSFSTFMLGMLALTAVGVNAFIVVIVAVFLPVLVAPFILSKTIYRDTKAVDIENLPKFTPQTGALPTLFNAAREGAELVFLLIIPAVAAVFAVIGLLEYIGVWKPIESTLSAGLLMLNIDPETGILSILATPTLAMAQLSEAAATMDPRLVIGSFVLASSGLPLSSILGQIPVIWAANSDLNEREAMSAAVIGIVMRLVTAFLVVYFLTPLLV
ncbi:hypothetical protein J6TS1_26580 [Siminovitchia terrae]|uniref:Uncharacterized protein n=1 Tax=Siminovitchia terrae TaxID=1914933 RepID=A0A429X4W2_SIMTE|nr:hypothetical protein [Siminovitchia terrae]RST58414.1 hypothetical protein D5F11_017330 [Siminovitchia terrae]GIN94009.1 hypothetical protein J22TS1_50600 [Siminovitchia terrae]GIN96788.1 hypothetical protein J6TS1_26580 [Siminovitchia terrae]